MDVKLHWILDHHRRYETYAVYHAEVKYDHTENTTMTGLREEHMDPIGHWCEENRCGKRLAFNMFAFKNEAEVTAFMLKWG